MKDVGKNTKKRINIKELIQKVWYLLWKDDSFKGWIFSLIFLFVCVQYIIFPLLRLVTGTTLPLAIVETCSMYHKGNFFSNFEGWFDTNKEERYSRYNISKEEFKNFPLKRGFSKGDILLFTKVNIKEIKVGDVIAFNAGTKSTPIVHRVIKIEEINGKRLFTTMGDNNLEVLKPNNNLWNIDEEEINEERIIGKAALRVAPSIGWAKLVFFENQKPSSERGLCKEN